MSQDTANKNRVATLPRIIVLALFIVYIAYRMVEVYDDDPVNLIRFILLMCVGAGAPILYVVFKYHRGFKKESPQYLIQFFNRCQSLGRSGSSGAWAYYKAVVYTLYGEYEKAHACLYEVEWDQQIPMYQANKYSVEALIHYLKPDDYAKGLLQAKKGMELCAGNINLPNMINNKQMIYVHIGNVLTNQIVSPETLAQLEKAFRFSSFYHKLIIAWALANGYAKSGNTEKSMKYSRYCEASAPYCIPLHRMALINR